MMTSELQKIWSHCSDEYHEYTNNAMFAGIMIMFKVGNLAFLALKISVVLQREHK